MPNPQLSILVVDDAKFSSVMIGRALSKAGYEDIRFANSASAALELIEQRPANVLLADWLMPEMDGYTLTAEIRNDPRLKNLHVMLHTSLSGVFNQAMVKKVGADDFLAKFKPDDLAQRVIDRLHATRE